METMTDALRQRLAAPTTAKMPVAETYQDRILNQLVLEAAAGNTDAARLVFERVDGAASCPPIDLTTLGKLKPFPIMMDLGRPAPGCRGMTPDPGSIVDGLGRRGVQVDRLPLDHPEVEAMTRLDAKYPPPPFSMAGDAIDAHD